MSALSPAVGGLRGRVRAVTQHDAWPLAIISIVVAAAAAALLQLAAWVNTLDGPVELFFIVGMVLLVWAAIACLATVIVLLRTARGGGASAVVTAAAVAIVAVTATLHPLLGSGGATG